jgi:hypothetical protein
MLKKREYHYDMDARNHETKMTQYRKFLEKTGDIWQNCLTFIIDATPPPQSNFAAVYSLTVTISSKIRAADGYLNITKLSSS